MRPGTTIALLASAMLLGGASIAQSPPAGMADPDAVLTSTEDWTEADTDDDGTLSQPELNRAEPRLAAYFREIDANGDWRISRDEITAWQARPEPNDVDADELPAGSVDGGDTGTSDGDRAAAPPDRDAPAQGRRTDPLLPDDGDKRPSCCPTMLTMARRPGARSSGKAANAEEEGPHPASRPTSPSLLGEVPSALTADSPSPLGEVQSTA